MKKTNLPSSIFKAFCAIVGLTILIGGCASPSEQSPPKITKPKDPTENWIKGSLTSLADGTVIPFRIEKKFAWGGSATGGVAATHPVTNEHFTGQYSAILPSNRGNAQFRTPSGQTFYGNYQQTGRNANAIANLTGDKGTIIQLQMEILAGWSPHGIGHGTDNRGHQYQVQF